MMITEYMKLTNEEKYAIRWHMGFTEPKELYGTIGEAYKKYPIALLLNEADLEATYFIIYRYIKSFSRVFLFETLFLCII